MAWFVLIKKDKSQALCLSNKRLGFSENGYDV